jgi:hypothetical protein
MVSQSSNTPFDGFHINPRDFRLQRQNETNLPWSDVDGIEVITRKMHRTIQGLKQISLLHQDISRAPLAEGAKLCRSAKLPVIYYSNLFDRIHIPQTTSFRNANVLLLQVDASFQSRSPPTNSEDSIP